MYYNEFINELKAWRLLETSRRISSFSDSASPLAKEKLRADPDPILSFDHSSPSTRRLKGVSPLSQDRNLEYLVLQLKNNEALFIQLTAGPYKIIEPTVVLIS